jgi:hypothetical protein
MIICSPLRHFKPVRVSGSAELTAVSPTAVDGPVEMPRLITVISAPFQIRKISRIPNPEFDPAVAFFSGLEATFKSYDQNADGKLSREEYLDPRAK